MKMTLIRALTVAGMLAMSAPAHANPCVLDCSLAGRVSSERVVKISRTVNRSNCRIISRRLTKATTTRAVI